MIGHPIKYSDFYDRATLPESPIDLILDIPKEELIATICSVNTRLKPASEIHFDNSRKTQVECLRTIFLDNNNPINNGISTNFILQFLEFPDNYILFTRVTCLYAFQEILNINEFVNERRGNYTVIQRENIFKFLLIANENLLSYSSSYGEIDEDGNAVHNMDQSFFEYFMFKELPHNQYFISSNPINAFYKAWCLFDGLNNDSFYQSHLKSFLLESFGIDDFSEFFRHIVSQFINSNDDNLKIGYLKVPKKLKIAIKILDKLSFRNNFPLPNRDDLKIFDFLEIKKSPLYKSSTTTDPNIETYMFLDNILFVEKTFSLFINDFWFDYLKKKNICGRNDWGNFIGDKFNEPFLLKIFKNSFKYNKRIKLFATNELLFDLKKGDGNTEYADFYIRQGSKIILAEAKSNYLPMVNGYKTVKTYNDYINLNLDEFYKSYGLLQLAKKTIKLFHDYKKYIKDYNFDFRKKVIIYPVLIVNDPIFSSGFACYAFKKKLKELLEKENVEDDNSSHTIKSLTIFNVTDLQDMEQSLQDGDENIFNIIRYYHSSVNEDRIPTEGSDVVLKRISHTVNKRIPSKLISNRIKRYKNWLLK